MAEILPFKRKETLVSPSDSRPVPEGGAVVVTAEEFASSREPTLQKRIENAALKHKILLDGKNGFLINPLNQSEGIRMNFHASTEQVEAFIEELSPHKVELVNFFLANRALSTIIHCWDSLEEYLPDHDALVTEALNLYPKNDGHLLGTDLLDDLLRRSLDFPNIEGLGTDVALQVLKMKDGVVPSHKQGATTKQVLSRLKDVFSNADKRSVIAAAVSDNDLGVLRAIDDGIISEEDMPEEVLGSLKLKYHI